MIKNCRICDGEFFDKPIISLKNMPESAQGFLDYKSDNQTMDINLVQCKFCGTIQLDCEPVDYYKNVIRVGGDTKTTSDIYKEKLREFIEKYNLQNKKIVEIGSGNGDFLRILKEFNIRCFGVEHSKNSITINSNGGGVIKVEKNFLDREDIILKDAPFDAFVQFNFMEHQPNPNIMMKAIYNNLSEDGVGFITVPNSDYIFNNGAFYQIIRDHLIYFSKESLFFFIQKNGFNVSKYFLVNNDNHGVFIEKRGLNINNKFDFVFDKLYNEISSYIKNYKKVAVWGAGHEALAILSCYNLNDKIEYVIDSSVFKQEKFSIGSNIKIISPSEAYQNLADAIIIIAPHYINEIKNLIEVNMPNSISISAIIGDELKILR